MKNTAITIVLLLLIAAATDAQAITVYLFRHAEKQTVAAGGDDPALTSAGIERAETARVILHDIDFTTIYSSNYRRTMQTAEIIRGTRSGAIEHYDPRQLAEFAEKIKNAPADSVLLVVGHSNTTPMLTHLLSGQPVSAIDESVYHHLYRVGINAGAAASLDLLSVPPLSNNAPLQALPLDAGRINEGEQTYRMSLGDQPVGESTWSYRIADDATHGPVVMLKEVTKLPEHQVDTQIDVMLARDSLQLLGIHAGGPMFGQDSAIQASFTQDGISGSSLFPRQPFEAQGELDLEQSVNAPYFERTAAIMLVAAVTALPDDAFSFRWFNTYNNEFRRIQVEHIGAESVTVPAGTFEADLIRYQGGSPSQVFYVSREEQPKVVKIEVIGTPWRYELL